MKHALELVPPQRSKDRFTADLLPPTARLFIAHDEVLIVYTREMEM
jgi:hypothetical protein